MLTVQRLSIFSDVATSDFKSNEINQIFFCFSVLNHEFRSIFVFFQGPSIRVAKQTNKSKGKVKIKFRPTRARDN
jgi:hypothetical protein